MKTPVEATATKDSEKEEVGEQSCQAPETGTSGNLENLMLRVRLSDHWQRKQLAGYASGLP
jgi:hypothetical protein